MTAPMVPSGPRPLPDGFPLFKKPKADRIVRRWRSGRVKGRNAEWAKVRSWVMDRARGRCEAYVRGVCTFRAEHVHHIRLRSQGGADTPDNLLALCSACHGFIHHNRAWSKQMGFIREGS